MTAHDGSQHEFYDTAVASYGAQLRSWVDLQVDARIGQVLPPLLEGELTVVDEKLAAETRLLSDVQAKLLLLLESLSDELASVKATTTSSAQVFEEMKACFARHDEALSESQRRHQKQEADMQCLQGVQQEVESLERRLSGWREELAAWRSE